MIASKKRQDTAPDAVIFGPISWIVDELIGIRTVEQRLSKKLESGAPTNSRLFLNKIHDLNLRVEVLDRALDEFSSGRI